MNEWMTILALFLFIGAVIVLVAGLRMQKQARNILSEQQEAQSEIDRLNKLYVALSECNQSIIRCKSQSELFQQLCRDVVEYTSLSMAWIGLINPETKRVEPVASHGARLEYLDTLRISADPDDDYGKGPAGRAIAQNTAVWVEDFRNEASLKGTWDSQIAFGWGSCGAMPLHRHGEVIGLFCLYHDQINAFNPRSRNLLVELVNDIDFAIGHFEREEKLRLSAEVIAQSNEGFILLDCSRRITMVNEAFTRITGYSFEDIQGEDTAILSTRLHERDFYSGMWTTVDRGENWQGEVRYRRKNGSIHHMWLNLSGMLDSEGQLSHYIAMFTDLTERKEVEEKVHQLVHYDPLTGLPNRMLLRERCNGAISVAQANGESIALMFVDFDNFKHVNDSLGHRIGDELLKEYAERLGSVITDRDTIARLGGDEFALILLGVNMDRATRLAQRLMQVTSEPFMIERHEINLTTSIGIAMYPSDGADFDALSSSADVAMFRAKENGRNNYCFFTQEMQESSARMLQLDSALRRALERNQFSLNYQPKMTLHDRRIVGFEALLRWEHPTLGWVSPAEFVPIAETNGEILHIGEWVIRTAARQLKGWLSEGFDNLTMAINLSAVQFRHPNLSRMIMSTIEEFELPPDAIYLELTEGIAMENPEAAIAVIDELQNHGFRISIDDFGTGYSSLAYLKRFRLHSLKIDRSFVNDISMDAEDITIVEAIISLADSLNMSTVAEGVETIEQLELLRERGCNEIQGYWLSRPLPADNVAAFLVEHGLKQGLSLDI